MNLFYCFVFISFSLDSAESTRISQQSPASEDRVDDLRRTLKYCKSVTVFLHPDDDKKEPHSNVNDFNIIGGSLEEWGQKDQNSLYVPPYIGGYLSSFEAPENNLGGQFVNDISIEESLLDMGPDVVESDIRSVEDPFEGIAGLDVGDLDAVDVIENSVLRRSSQSAKACINACCDAVVDSCNESHCSSDLRHDFQRNCKSACKNEF